MGNSDSAPWTIVGALGARRPEARYMVGTDAKAVAAFDRFGIALLRDRVNRFLADL